MGTSFIHTQILVHLHVNKTNFHMKGFTLGLALKQRRNATRKSLIVSMVCLPLCNKVTAYYGTTMPEYILYVVIWLLYISVKAGSLEQNP